MCFLIGDAEVEVPGIGGEPVGNLFGPLDGSDPRAEQKVFQHQCLDLSRTLQAESGDLEQPLRFSDASSTHSSRMSRQNKGSFLGNALNKLKPTINDNQSVSSMQGSQVTASDMGWINEISFRSHKESKEKRDLERAENLIYRNF